MANKPYMEDDTRMSEQHLVILEDEVNRELQKRVQRQQNFQWQRRHNCKQSPLQKLSALANHSKTINIEFTCHLPKIGGISKEDQEWLDAFYQ
jgi:hypothetical protein